MHIILGVQVLEIDPLTLGTAGSLRDLLAGMQYAIAEGADVINLTRCAS